MRGGTSTPVAQGDLKGSGGAMGGPGKADGFKYGDSNTSVSQGPATGKNRGHDPLKASKQYGASDRNGILGTLTRQDKNHQGPDNRAT